MRLGASARRASLAAAPEFTMRLFACCLLGPGARSFYDEVVAKLVHRHPQLLRAIPPDSAHVTYTFIPHLASASLPTLIDALHRALAETRPVVVTIGRPEVLVAGRDARLVHAPIVDGAQDLADLRSRITQALEQALPGVTISPSRSAHVTLARFRRGTERRLATPVVESLAHADIGVRPDRFTAVYLMLSELTGATPVYSVQARVDLGG